MLGDKFRFRFAKTGTLRLLSHHDLMRCLERMLRRADLPFKSTSGFHPGPRVVFALSLPLGVEGLDEVLEIEFTRLCDPDDVLARLRRQTPAGLAFNQISCVPMKATAIPRRAAYRLNLPEGRIADISIRAQELLARDAIWVDRLKPSPKQLNVRRYLRKLSIDELVAEHPGQGVPADTHTLMLDFWVTQTGTARVSEFLELLDLTDLVESGGVVQRTTVEIRDEVTNADAADQPPSEPAETLPLEAAAVAALTRREEEQAAVGRSVLPAGPVVE